MKNKFAALALAATVLAQVGIGAFADDAAKGPMTNSANPVWTVVSFPFRVVTGAGGSVIGATYTGIKGIATSEETFAHNTFGKADENPLLVPVGVIGTAVAIPYGFVTGAPEGGVKGASYGYHLWDNF